MTISEDYLQPPEPQPLSMAYDLGTAGWASFEVSCGSESFRVSDFGYITDGLGDIVRAALALVAGASQAEVLFDCEPQVWGLAVVFAGLAADAQPPIRICRVTIRDGGTGLEQGGHGVRPVWAWEGPIVFEGFVRSDDFGRAALAMAKAVRADFDDATYRERWGHYASLEGFPLRGLKALETALQITEYRE